MKRAAFHRLPGNFDPTRFQYEKRAANVAFMEKDFPGGVGARDQRLKEVAEFMPSDVFKERNFLQKLSFSAEIRIEQIIFEETEHGSLWSIAGNRPGSRKI